MENQFNDSQKFEKELVEMLVSLIDEKLKATVEYLLQTHNLKPLKDILEILENNNY